MRARISGFDKAPSPAITAAIRPMIRLVTLCFVVIPVSGGRAAEGLSFQRPQSCATSGCHGVAWAKIKTELFSRTRYSPHAICHRVARR